MDQKESKLHVPCAAALQLVNMSINPFEINTLLISAQREKEKENPKQQQNKLLAPAKSIQKKIFSAETKKEIYKDCERKRGGEGARILTEL